MKAREEATHAADAAGHPVSAGSTASPRNEATQAGDGDAPLLSIVIPAHDEERRLPPTLERLLSFLDRQPYLGEIVVVENASRDATFRVASEAAARDGRVRVLSEPRRGKGAAVRRGMLAARGRLRLLCDADLSMPPEEIPRLLAPAREGAAVVIGTREGAGAVRYDEPRRRHWIGRAFNALVRMLLLPGIHDTQCGFKCFRAEAAETVFRRVTRRGFAFDVEALAIARDRGLPIVEVPIPWRFDPDSRVRVLRDSLRMGFDLLLIAWRRARGGYRGG